MPRRSDNRCAVCGSPATRPAWRVAGEGTESGVNPVAFRPSSDRFGETTGSVVRCGDCGHGRVVDLPSSEAVAAAYQDAADPVAQREEAGQVATAERALEQIEKVTPVERVLEIGCWTASFLVAARRRGWEVAGLEPSTWAVGRARERGVDVVQGALEDNAFPSESFSLVVACDVIEHLADPADAVARMRALLCPQGVLYLTTPDAGSRLARLLGRRWWSVLPMHLQYFTRASITRLLEDAGFEVVSLDTHPKVFSARYYAERFAAFVPVVGGAASRAVARSRWAERLIGPDFRDRMAVLARVSPRS